MPSTSARPCSPSIRPSSRRRSSACTSSASVSAMSAAPWSTKCSPNARTSSRSADSILRIMGLANSRKMLIDPAGMGSLAIGAPNSPTPPRTARLKRLSKPSPTSIWKTASSSTTPPAPKPAKSTNRPGPQHRRGRLQQGRHQFRTGPLRRPQGTRPASAGWSTDSRPMWGPDCR